MTSSRLLNIEAVDKVMYIYRSVQCDYFFPLCYCRLLFKLAIE